MIESIRGVDAPQRTSRRTSRGNRLTPYVFIGPAFIVLLAFGLLPILIAAGVSLTDLDLRGLGDPSTVKFVGLENYHRLLGDADFWSALGNTGFFILIGVPVIIVGSLAVAIALHQSSSRF